ncbi:MAG: threonine--tRNA ligase [Mycoplasmataceae bacterium]|nr:threonine--tRNA ligase [Mycoplasmataceae bacterium]
MKINKDLNKISGIVLAMALKKLYPSIVLADVEVGDQIANEWGFNYQFNLKESISIKDLPKIKKEMEKLIAGNPAIKYEVVDKKELKELFKNNKYKLELLEDAKKVGVVKIGDYVDICEKLSIAKLSAIKNVELLNVGGMYWLHSAKNDQLQAISGIAFENAGEKKAWEEEQKDRKERDHREINKSMELFAFSDMSGAGLPYWLPAGAAAKFEIDNYIHKLLLRHGYSYVQTPVLGRKELYETSGHWFHYRENMFAPCQIDEDIEVLRPMTCPHHLTVYQMKQRSYKELPFKVFEDAILHRYESSGSLTGLQRVRQMRLIDTHMVCSLDQIAETVKGAYDCIQEAAKVFDLPPQWIELSLHDANNKEKFFDGEEKWQAAENKLREVLKNMKVDYKEAVGEAAFYGPKIDMQIKTALGNVVTAYTIQLDFLLPERFQLEFINKDGKKERPVLIHASVIGTLERFMSIMLEQNKGNFPVWIAPVQVALIPVSNEKHIGKCKELQQFFLNNDIRVKLYNNDERVGKNIAVSQSAKDKYQIVIGDEELKGKNIKYRAYGSEKEVVSNLDEFLKLLKEQIASKK